MYVIETKFQINISQQNQYFPLLVKKMENTFLGQPIHSNIKYLYWPYHITQIVNI